MEQAPFSIQLFSPDGRTVRVNRAWEKLWGIDADQIFDYNVLEDPQLEAKGVVASLRRAFSGVPVEIPAVEYDTNVSVPHLTQGPGTRRWVSAVAYPLLGAAGEVQEVVLIHQDITARKLAEEALQKSEAQLRFIADQVPVHIVKVDAALRFTFVNSSYAGRFGLRPEQIVGRRVSEIVGATGLESFRAHVEASLRGERVEFEQQVPYEQIGPRWIHATCVPEFDAAGSVSGVIAVLQDITARKLGEESLHAAKEAAEASSRAKDNFLAALSHELRTPLTPILMTAAILREDQRLPEDVRAEMAMVERNVALEARLIDDLLDLTRITHGKLVLRTELCDLHLLLGFAIEMVQDEAHERKVEIVPALAAHHHFIIADPVRVQQVLWNLLRNAVKFSVPGGRIDVRSRDASSSSGRREVEVHVSDNGVGFEPRDAEIIFEPFQQATSGEHRFGGLGLGLAIARGIVELHGGRIHATSAGPGRGASFTVALPAGPAGVPPRVMPSKAGNQPAQPVTPRRPLHLLVVEDHLPTIRVLTRMLEKIGHKVVAVGTVTAAQAAARAMSFDAVLSDIGLPDGSGLDLMSELRQTYGLRGVALSGYGMEEDLRVSRAAGFEAHLVKPVDPNELKMILARIAGD